MLESSLGRQSKGMGSVGFSVMTLFHLHLPDLYIYFSIYSEFRQKGILYFGPLKISSVVLSGYSLFPSLNSAFLCTLHSQADLLHFGVETESSRFTLILQVTISVKRK